MTIDGPERSRDGSPLSLEFRGSDITGIQSRSSGGEIEKND